VVRSGHNEELERINFRLVFLVFFGGRNEKEDTKKKKFLNSVYMNDRVVRWASILSPFAECLPMQSSIQQNVV
jgi:hypothetical protein